MKTHFFKIYVFLFFTLSIANTHAYFENSDSKSEHITMMNALNNFAHELAICATYFSLLAAGLEEHDAVNNAEDIQQLRSFIKSFYSASSEITSIEVTNARVSMAMPGMQKIVQDQLGGWSVLMNKHHLICKDIAYFPDKRLNFWLNKNNP